jgi:hypothetical protein
MYNIFSPKRLCILFWVSLLIFGLMLLTFAKLMSSNITWKKIISEIQGIVVILWYTHI